MLSWVGFARLTCPLSLQLVEVLNEDYGEYVGLSSRLVNVDGAVIRMRQPLIDTQVRRMFCSKVFACYQIIENW